MGLETLFLVILAFLPLISAQKSEGAQLVVNTSTIIAETDANYICATIDWWPKEKCNYNRCPWGSASVLNFDISHPLLSNAIQAFKNLRIRIGGSLEDQVLYGVGNLTSSCHPFRKEKGGLFGFSKGCLPMDRWDELNIFFKKTGVILTFGLNALYGRHNSRGVWRGNWDSSNARDFMKYCISKGYSIDSWEFGNELSGSGVGARVNADQYGKDVIRLKALIDELYADFQPRPALLAPGGFYDKSWFNTLLQVSGPGVVNAVTHHLYSLGPGSDHNIKNNILSPDHLNKDSYTFASVTSSIQTYGPWASAWVGESGGAYNSGAWGISDTFLNSFWYLDQLGMAAKYKTSVYCRQTLFGGFYGLLNKTSFVPNPDFYGALLWHRLMGTGVLAVDIQASPYLRAYAHCAKDRPGIAILLINLSNETNYTVDVNVETNYKVELVMKSRKGGGSFSHGLRQSVSWVGKVATGEELYREEYHLTPDNGDLQSRTVLLNGARLQVGERGEIPSLDAVFNDIKSSLILDPLSIKFVVYPNFDAPGCIL